MSSEQKHPRLPAKPPYFIIAAVLVLLALLFVVQSFGPGGDAAKEAAEKASVPMTDLTLAAAFKETPGAISDSSTPVKGVLDQTIKSLEANLKQDPSFEAAARFMLVVQCFANVDASVDASSFKHAKSIVSGETSPKRQQLKKLLLKKLDDWTPKDAQDILQSDVGPVKYLVAQRVFDANHLSRNRDDAAAQLSDIASLCAFKFTLMLSVMIFMMLGGASAWVLYWSGGTKMRVSPPPPEKDSKGGKIYWEVTAAFLAIYIIVNILIQVLGITVPVFKKMDDDILMMLSYILVALVALPVSAAQLKKAGLSLKAVGWRTEDPVTDIAWGLGGFFAAVSLTTLLMIASGILLNALGIKQATSPAVGIFLSKQLGWQTVCIILIVTFIAPLVEETYFRGSLLKGIWLPLGSASAIWGSSFAFAMVHPGGIVLLLPYIALGFVFSRMTLFRRSLLPSMIAHGLNNLFTVAIIMLLQP